MSEHIGPSLWHGREVNSCTRCKYLKCSLRKSGRHPDYDYFCRHPDVLSGKHFETSNGALLEKIKEKFPEKYQAFAESLQRRQGTISEQGEFISNDCDTPETPHWCPVINSEKKGPQ